MNLKQSFLWLILIFPSPAMAQKGTIASFSPATPPVIDGDMIDWETDWLLDPKGKFAYNIANDDKNLYYRIKIVDETTQHKVGLFGLSVLLNPTGKKAGKLGIKFPMGKDPDEIKNMKPPEGAPTAESRAKLNKDLIQDSEALELIGLAKENIVSSRLGLMNGIEVIIVADPAGDYIYEGKIPFKSFKIKKSSVKTLGVTIRTGKLPPPKSQNTSAMPPASSFGQGSGYGPRGYGYGNRGQMGGYGGYNNAQYAQMAIPNVPFSEFSVATSMSVNVVLK